MLLSVLRESNWPVYGLLSAMAGAARIFEVLDQQPAIDDRRAAGDRGITSVGQLRVRGLSHAYPCSSGDPRAALRDVSLTVQRGELVAIVGRIGSGKSTLLRCLARQVDPDAGTIELDGRALHELPLRALRSVLTFVSQDCFLFATTLAQNIAFDDPSRTTEQIGRAAHAAALVGTIARLPEGLETQIGERGVRLSGGQRQRTGLARGLIRHTPVLLLDDCLSALDAEKEATVLARLEDGRSERATVMVTHRLSSARRADRIYVLDEGRVVEQGRHEELLALGGHYARLTRAEPRASTTAPRAGDHEHERAIASHSV
jgi:ATP-binding cassette subfamily B protein